MQISSPYPASISASPIKPLDLQNFDTKQNPAAASVVTRLDSAISDQSAQSANAVDAMSFLQTRESALTQVIDQTSKIKELELQKGNGILTDDQRGMIDNQINASKEEIGRITSDSSFAGKSVFNTSNIEGSALSSVALNDDSFSSLENIDETISMLSESRSESGAIASGLESKIDQLSNVNLQEARNRNEPDQIAAISASTQDNIKQDVQNAVAVKARVSESQVLQLLQS